MCRPHTLYYCIKNYTGEPLGLSLLIITNDLLLPRPLSRTIPTNSLFIMT